MVRTTKNVVAGENEVVLDLKQKSIEDQHSIF